MKHILSYNESFSSEELNLLLKNSANQTLRNLELLEPYKGKLRKLSHEIHN
jgi:hypothetical protein